MNNGVNYGETMNYDQAEQMYKTILNSTHSELRRELLIKAVEYSHIRSHWKLSPPEERRRMDPMRTLAHNAFIDACNIMSRNMKEQNEDNSWRTELGGDRKIIGDLACYIQLFLAIEAR